MQTVLFGNTGVPVSRMCLGTMMFGDRCDEAEAGRIVDAALERGVTFFDTAPVYNNGQSEAILGRALAGRRGDAFLATKVNVGDGADYPAAIASSLDASLQRLHTDYVDLFLLHWARRHMAPAAILEELAAVVRAGKARFVGVCNFPAWLLAHFNALAVQIGAPRLVNNQVPYNLIERGVEVEVLPQAAAEAIAITCYRPLMGGVLTGKYTPAQPPPADSRAAEDERLTTWATDHAAGLRALTELAAARGVPPAHVAIAWLAAQPGVTCPIIGVSRLAQLHTAADAFTLALAPDACDGLAAAFGTAVKEVSQYYGPLRRAFDLLV